MSLDLLARDAAHSETGYDLWRRYRPGNPTVVRKACRRATAAIGVPAQSPTNVAAPDELRRGLMGLLGAEAPLAARVSADGAVAAEHARQHCLDHFQSFSKRPIQPAHAAASPPPQGR